MVVTNGSTSPRDSHI